MLTPESLARQARQTGSTSWRGGGGNGHAAVGAEVWGGGCRFSRATPWRWRVTMTRTNKYEIKSLRLGTGFHS